MEDNYCLTWLFFDKIRTKFSLVSNYIPFMYVLTHLHELIPINHQCSLLYISERQT